ncbi:MAG: divergent polysaccharide deacetylase family protein [Thermodesulfobacteriota bacterium]|nr:divergent polysaccharide deacetylase family protein [Thermodesulfobacteriota bacterium]
MVNRINRRTRKKSNTRFFLPLVLVLFLVGTLSAVVYFVFLGPGTVTPPKPESLTTVHKTTPLINTQKPVPAVPSSDPVAIAPEIKTLAEPKAEIKKKPLVAIPEAETEKKPLVAIIIDDMGYRKAVGERFLELDMELSFSFLPFGPHTKDLSQKAGQLGKDILLHLPMEPNDLKSDPGLGALMVSMNKKTIQKIFKKDLAEVPMAIGVNNHMGSRFTSSPKAMRIVLEQIRAEGLFFLDSLTISKSVGFSMAGAMGIKTIKRDVFLDNNLNKKKIINQLESLVKIAEKHGQAIGIGHPNRETLDAVIEFGNRLKSRVSLVGVHELGMMNDE